MKKKFYIFYTLCSILVFLFLNSAVTAFGLEYITESSFTTNIGNPPADAGADISACTFYRGGDGVSGAKIGNPEMAAFISEVAAKVGVPPAILAGILRVESSQAITTADRSYLSNDYDKHNSPVGATGAMQFMPSTFADVFQTNRTQLASLFNKTSVREAVDPPESAIAKDQRVLRIYSVKDSIIAAAFKVKNDSGGKPWSLETIRTVIGKYYGNGCYKYPNCSSGPYDYADDVWKSYTNCAGTATTPGQPPRAGAILCPVPRGGGYQGLVTCGPSRPKTTSYAACSVGHCKGDYCPRGVCPSYCTLYPATDFAADVAGPAGQVVSIPDITIPETGESHPITCKYEGSERSANFPNESIVKFSCNDTVTNKYIWIQFHHIRTGTQPPNAGTMFKSGDPVVGKIDKDHTHVQIGIGGACAGAYTSYCVGADIYLKCK